jgi:hypothetical protein
MVTSAQCRVNVKKRLLRGKSVHIPLRRRTQAISKAVKWTALAEGIDREDAKQNADDLMRAGVKWRKVVAAVQRENSISDLSSFAWTVAIKCHSIPRSVHSPLVCASGASSALLSHTMARAR